MLKSLNLNIDHWSMLDFTDSSEPQSFAQEIEATLAGISPTNIYDVLFELDDHEYVT
jgi:hypothetical protein